MIFKKHIPDPSLQSYVESIIYIAGNNKGTGFPKTAMSLVFNLGDPFKMYADKDFTRYFDRRTKHWIAGLQTEPIHVESHGESLMVVVQFKTLGAFTFLGQPLHSFTGEFITLDCVFKSEADDVWEQMQEAPSPEEKIRIAENFLLAKLLKKSAPDTRLLASVESILRHNGAMSITQICREYGVSRKHLNFLFKEYSGVSPKMLSSLYRLHHVLKTITHRKPETLTDFALELDYFDQAHFNNDFKRFTGLKPTEYIRCVNSYPVLKIIPHFIPYDAR